MKRARFSIGIDLGTTNTALAFVRLDAAGPSTAFPIPQLESAVSIVEATTLPSFLYLPDSDAPADGEDAAVAGGWTIGRYARAKATETPGRVVHSAKSWLAHHSADRTASFLPWGSDDLGREQKISPLRASTLILRYLRDAWNDRFAAQGADAGFDSQIVTITVPASFDAVAQRLTLAAARDAGYSENVRLLEEPQAALYRWLEAHDPALNPDSAAAAHAAALHVLVVDIGGGTSDFSLFEFRPNDLGGAAHIKRIAVSDHLLLGGDNMDLALAHRLEPQLAGDDETLAGRLWADLVARSRDLKETALSSAGSSDEVFSVAIAGRGARLIAQAHSASLARADIEALLLDGFFPHCGANEYPIRAKSALRELGLPFARDPAVTRHLAEFLRDRPRVDAVLFNGGALHPQRLRERIVGVIASWQSGVAPIVLENQEPDLAVARGAARFGELVAARAQRIEAGAAQAIFVQTHRPADEPMDDRAASLVCVLPHGAPTEQVFAIRDLALELRVNQPVRFVTYTSARHESQRPGDLATWNDLDFRALPPLETTVDVEHAPAHQTVPVLLNARLTELGRLELACVSTDPTIHGSWPLEFNLRHMRSVDGATRAAASVGAGGVDGPNVSDAALDAARLRLATMFGRSLDNRDKLTATRLLKSLETMLGAPRNQWNIVLVRSLWATLEHCSPCRARSIAHEEAWLILAGFFLRPGFGAAMDETRIDRLWTVHETGLCFRAKSVTVQASVLWRRVAGGLSAQRQERVLEPDWQTLRRLSNPPPELILLAGSLERLSLARKAELIDRWIETAAALESEKKHNAHYLAALGSILNRAPLHGGPEVVVPPDFVQRAFEAFEPFAWDGPKLAEYQATFVRAARVVDSRGLDVPRALRRRIADKLERAGVPAAKTAPLKDYMPVQRSERAGSFGESLPPGLILREPSSS